MNNSKPTQCVRVLNYMRDFGEIDTMTAIRELGCMRLASRISELKRQGYKITRRMESGKNRYGEKVSWAVYSMEGTA